ncbi:MAG: cell envelope integrity protein CreD [Paludibacter sp.]
METIIKRAEKFSQSITVKAIIIGFLTLILLIPGSMIQNLIQEREQRSNETIEKINSKWSNAQTITGPVLSVPYVYSYSDEKNVTKTERHILNITPEVLDMNAKVLPEERHIGIYKSILYKSELQISGKFGKIDTQKLTYSSILWNEATIRIGITDLRGVTNNIDFVLDGLHFNAEAGGSRQDAIGQGLVITPNHAELFIADKELSFNCTLHLNGSSNLNFIPMGKTTKVEMNGAWQAPGFTGSFSPTHSMTEKGFKANWQILHFNRSIPETWIDNQVDNFNDTKFGVDLVDTVDHYQQNMRSAKYALMFIALTFVVFFFVEVLTKKKIHPIQYLLVGIALILFYSLLLSISEQLNFGLAYLIASVATIGLISLYAHSIFKNRTQTGMLATILSVLYIFLYVVLQLEDVALLFGSIGLFIILGIIMYFSKRINWYKQDETEDDQK